MITAIPMNEERIASHFTKADSLLFVDAQGKEIGRHANPALGADCAGKQRLLDLIVQQGAGRVVVRNIGRQMLGRLLAHKLTVLQAERGHRHAADVARSAAGMVPLTDASQGRPSVNHDARQKAGGCGCGHTHDEPRQHGAGGCCQPHGHGHSHDEEHQCCGGHDHGHQHKGHQHHGRGHGRCCHS